MPDRTLLDQLRELRRKAEEINRTVVDDYRPFLNPIDKTTFFRCPTAPPASPEPNITPTCTAFMAHRTHRFPKKFLSAEVGRRRSQLDEIATFSR